MLDVALERKTGGRNMNKVTELPGEDYYIDENGSVRKGKKPKKPVSKSVVVKVPTLSAGGGPRRPGG